MRGVLGLERIRHVVAFELLIAIEEQRRDVGAAVEVHEPQAGAARQHADQ